MRKMVKNHLNHFDQAFVRINGHSIAFAICQKVLSVAAEIDRFPHFSSNMNLQNGNLQW
jgi:hypothetical protein